mmetsp:Transcript_17720/g.40021  ORF Transcript_17720/g.40021 Transcript_17720/m.40021 type:complete len:205 (-) Transcript_17720:913-1527(-)
MAQGPLPWLAGAGCGRPGGAEPRAHPGGARRARDAGAALLRRGGHEALRRPPRLLEPAPVAAARALGRRRARRSSARAALARRCFLRLAAGPRSGGCEPGHIAPALGAGAVEPLAFLLRGPCAAGHYWPGSRRAACLDQLRRGPRLQRGQRPPGQAQRLRPAARGQEPRAAHQHGAHHARPRLERAAHDLRGAVDLRLHQLRGR